MKNGRGAVAVTFVFVCGAHVSSLSVTYAPVAHALSRQIDAIQIAAIGH
jgi:hypothetical protein